MDSRITMLLMALMTFFSYPLLSDNDRKQVAPLATQMDEPEDEEEPEDDGEPVMMDDDDDEVSDLQLSQENKYIREKVMDQQIAGEKKAINDKAADSQLSQEEDTEENIH